MTQEEKAKAYDEAIKKLRSLHDDYDTISTLIEVKEELEEIFPELKETEDEKIRKELLEHCKNQAKPYIDTGNKCPQIQSWIAWLEKQGEQKPVEWNEEDDYMLESIISDFYGGHKSSIGQDKWLKSLREKFKKK